MKKLVAFVAVMLIVVMMAPAMAAPLFGDVPASHWAKDAIASLAAKGLIEGYPDGTFKGDRASTRYEMAMIIARLLAKVDQMGANYASKADMETMKTLANNLKDELGAMGVRVTSAEDNLQKLGGRVTALEKITFYGSFDTIVNTMGFTNGGNAAYNQYVGNISGSQLSADSSYAGYRGSLPIVANINTTAINPTPGGAFVPTSAFMAFGKVPVVDYINGRAMTNGTGASTLANLGLKIRVSDDISAGAEFAAYVSAGDFVQDAIWGVSAPWLANPYTSLGNINNGSVQPLNNQPWTRMVLDNFWFTHNPTGTKVTVGAFKMTNMDPIVLKGVENPNANGPDYLPYYGFNIAGKFKLLVPFKFEVLGTRLPDEGTSLPNGSMTYVPPVHNPPSVAPTANLNYAQAYYNWAFGMNLDYAFNGGNVKLNFLRVANDQSNGSAMVTGGNLHNPYYWVNPDTYLSQDLGVAADRPIVANNNFPGSYGPQGMSTFGVSLNYKIPIKWDLRFIGEAAGSTYQPNMGSKFEQSGVAGKASLATSLVGGNLGLQLDYISVDPYYDPFVLAYPTPASNFSVPFVRAPNFAYYNGLYQLHDSYEYPDNRQGLRFKVDYKFAENSNVYLRYGSLQQQTASIPNAGSDFNNYSGFLPGFVEPVFSPLYGDETTKGRVENWGLGLSYKIPTYKLKINVGYDDYSYKRDSSIAYNYTNMRAAQGRIGLAYPLTEKFTLKGGYNFASVSAKAKYINTNAEYGAVDSSQTIPYLGFDYNISQNTNWGLMLKAFNTTDNTNESDMGNKFQWSGSQILTELKVSF
ncbi:MAG: S-layer homology domain-containing protein [bacterium]